MKIAYIIPGTGGTFYCQNCVRDISSVKALRELGHEVTAVPLYLSPHIGDEKITTNAPIFYGAVNLYLNHKFPIMRRIPFLRKVLDAGFLLEWAGRKSGSTEAHGLEELTLSMLKGEWGDQADELDRMVKWLRSEKDIDIIHISNALLLGVVNRLKNEIDVPIVCSLQDEDQWISSMEDSFMEQIWDIIREKSSMVDGFIGVSEYYSDLMHHKLKIDDNKIFTIPMGIDPDVFDRSVLPFDPPVIGYMARISKSQGLDLLLDGFRLLKKKEKFRSVKLHVNGGQTGYDVSFIKTINKKISDWGMEKDVIFFDRFGEKDRSAFYKDLTVISVPAPQGEAFGLFQIEAMAAGVPVVQPEVGAYPEIIKATGGGITYTPNEPGKLAEALEKYLSDPEKVKAYSSAGLESVRRNFNNSMVSKAIVKVYSDLINNY